MIATPDSSQLDYEPGAQEGAGHESGLIPPDFESGRLLEEIETVDNTRFNVYEYGSRRYGHLFLPEGTEQALLVPRAFDSFEDMEGRELEIAWLGEEKPAIEVYSSILEGLNTFVSLKYPGYWMITPVVVYADRGPGKPSLHTYQYASVIHFLKEIKEETTRMGSGGFEEFWTGGYSGVVHISPEPGYTMHAGLYPSDPYEEFQHRMSFSMADLDITSTINPQEDLSETAALLRDNGFSGWLIRSGAPEKGGYHYLADSMTPYAPGYWRTLGHLTEILTPKIEELDYIHDFAQSLIKADGSGEAAVMGRGILEGVISDSVTGSKIDVRWVGHNLERGVSILRSEMAKEYVSPPMVVAEIK